VEDEKNEENDKGENADDERPGFGRLPVDDKALNKVALLESVFGVVLNDVHLLGK
jgi:hypothetical protein